MNSFISWIGGKRLLRNKILAEFPEEGSYERYIEVFGGAGWILFSRDQHAKTEVYNDVNGNLVNLFRCVKCHPEALQKELEWILLSREVFFDAIHESRGLTDIQRAARFWISLKESFGSDGSSFGTRPKNMINAVEFLKDASIRLKSVVIENVDFERLLKTYDRPNALIYLDPPYFEAEKYYPDRFQPEDHIRLRDALKRVKGKFVLSYNDCAEIRELYKDYNIIAVERQNTLKTKNGGGMYKEVIIKNY